MTRYANLYGTKTKQEVTRVIYRCKPCRATRRISYDTEVVTETFPTYQPNGLEIPKCKTRRVFRLQGKTVGLNFVPDRECCGRFMGHVVVEGRENPEVPCNVRCVNAVGPSCDCACGGLHHGEAHEDK